MQDELHQCLYCQGDIVVGRSDKKFCNSECKDEYYNKIKIREHKEIKKIDTILKRNRRILKKSYSQNQLAKLPREVLVKGGFEFGFYTHRVITQSRSNEIIFCYDYGYREISTDIFQVYSSFSKVQVKDGEVTEIR